MDTDTKDEGRAANIRGISRKKNPYVSRKDTGKAVLWDTGWLMQTQHGAGKPDSMCKGKNCTAMCGVGHSSECEKEHKDTVNGLMPHFEP